MKNQVKPQEPSLIEDISHKYIPYWPLFVILLIPCLALALAYLKYRVPEYEVKATIEVKDEKKGIDEDRITTNINMLATKSVVENEVEILRSRRFMDSVVRSLYLYAPISQEGEQKSVSAYVSSPINIEVAEPQSLNEVEKTYFTYDFNKQLVTVGNKSYPLNQWVYVVNNKLRFVKNTKFRESTKDKLYFRLVKPHKVTGGLLAALDVSAVGKTSSIINITFKDNVPPRGEDVVNELISKYNTAGIEYKTQLAKNTLEYLDRSIARVAGQLNNAEKKIQVYRAREGVVNLTDQSRLVLQNVAMNDQKLAELNMQLSVLDQVENYVQAKDGAARIVPSTFGVNDPLLLKLLERLYEAEIQHEKLKQTTGENNPSVKTLANQVQSLKPAILENIRNHRASLEAGKANLSNTNSAYNTVLGSLPEKERQLVDVSRDQAIIKETYNFLLNQREKTALAYSASITDTKIVDPARASVLPVSPNKPYTMGMALGLALIGTIAFVLWRDVLSNKVLFRSEIDRSTTTPVIGEVSYYGKSRKNPLEAFSNLAIQDEIRQMSIAAGLLSKGNTVKKLLITSGEAGAGKSFLSINLAYNLAQAGKKVALLDMNLRDPKLSSTFKMGEAKGIADYLESKATVTEITRKTEYNNLYVIPAGTVAANSTPMLLNGGLEKLMNELSGEYDFIVMDTAAVYPATDAYLLSELSDATFYATRHRHTPKAAVKKLDESTRLKPLKNLSVVFNGIKERGMFIKMKGFGYGSAT